MTSVHHKKRNHAAERSCAVSKVVVQNIIDKADQSDNSVHNGEDGCNSRREPTPLTNIIRLIKQKSYHKCDSFLF